MEFIVDVDLNRDVISVDETTKAVQGCCVESLWETSYMAGLGDRIPATLSSLNEASIEVVNDENSNNSSDDEAEVYLVKDGEDVYGGPDADHKCKQENESSSSDSLEFPQSIGGSECSEKENIDGMVQKITAQLAVGSVIESLDVAYLLYCEYARLIGFSVKRGTQAYFQKTDVIRMKMYFCSSEGRTDNRASKERIASYKKQHTRTDCKARLRIVREFGGSWKVAVFEDAHNHELLGPDDSYLLRSSRNLNLAKRKILETFCDAGIGVSRAFRYMRNEVGGAHNVGYICKDAYDHINRIQRVSKIGNADADALMQYFQNKAASEPYFFWRVLLDDDGRLMNVYWRDSRCAYDYAIFGDVVSVDTTFRTNKYNLICAPFVGMNHHRQTCMFGMGFLSNETASSFQWLFSVFLESMEGKEPSIIFSDQDQAMMRGIDLVFQSAAHRLCQWHVNQNAPAHFGKLKSVQQFKDMWFKCMNGCQDEDEFEQVWDTMVGMYDLQTKKWFSSMYDLRRRWSDVFTNNRFSGGLKATSRSELTNKVIKDVCAASTSLFEFVSYYDNIISDWRTREREEDALCRGLPGQCVNGNRLLSQAAAVYTRSMYKIFENEAVMSINVDIISSPEDVDASILIFEVLSSASKVKRKVVYNPLADEVSCTCAMLTTHGMFCKHILKVFYTMNVTSLPKKFILKRWTRDAKSDAPSEMLTKSLSPKKGGEEMIFVNTVMRRMYDLALQWKDKEDYRVKVLKTLASLEDHFRGVKTTTKKKSKSKGATENTYGVSNPPAPEHRWLPPKRQTTVFKRKKLSPQKGKKDASSEVKKVEP